MMCSVLVSAVFEFLSIPQARVYAWGSVFRASIFLCCDFASEGAGTHNV
jgi:hypothetical protein